VYVYEDIRRAKDNDHTRDPVKNGIYREVCYDHQTEEQVIERLEIFTIDKVALVMSNNSDPNIRPIGEQINDRI